MIGPKKLSPTPQVRAFEVFVAVKNALHSANDHEDTLQKLASHTYDAEPVVQASEDPGFAAQVPGATAAAVSGSQQVRRGGHSIAAGQCHPCPPYMHRTCRT